MPRPTDSPRTSYHPAMVLLHWLLAVLIIGSLLFGYFKMAPMANSDPLKVTLLRLHMAGGMLILALMIIRLCFRLFTSRPARAKTGEPLLDGLASFTHGAFYVLVALMAATGLSTAVISGINTIVFGETGERLPPSLLIYPTRIAHGYLAAAFVVLIGLHVVGALYHHFLLRDRLLRRMWFTSR